jgi:tight adherence protein B
MATTAFVLACLLAFDRRTRAARGMSRSAAWLAEYGSSMSGARFAAVRLGAALCSLLLVAGVTGSPLVALPPAAAAGWIPKVLIARRREQRLQAVARAWPDGLRELAASVSAGMSLPQALDALARTGPDALREAFGRLPALLPVFGLRDTLEQVRVRAADPTTDRIVEVLLLAHERGGRILPELLTDLAQAATADLHLQERLATAQLELRINARAVFVLPWLVLCALTARPGPFRTFYASADGVPVILAAAGLSLIGMALVTRLGRPPIEPRVLAGGGA